MHKIVIRSGVDRGRVLKFKMSYQFSSTFGVASPSMSHARKKPFCSTKSSRQVPDSLMTKCPFPPLIKSMTTLPTQPTINKNRENSSFKPCRPHLKVYSIVIQISSSPSFAFRKRMREKYFEGICDGEIIIQMSLHFSQTYVNERLRFSDG